IEGNLIRLLQTPPGSLPAPLLQPTASINNISSDPKFVFALPSEMYMSSVSLKGPPSPRRNLPTARSAIVSWNGTVVVTLPFVAEIDRLYVPVGDAGVVFTTNRDVNRESPFDGTNAHATAAGHPDTLRETRPVSVPYTRTVAAAESFFVVCTDGASTETFRPVESR